MELGPIPEIWANIRALHFTTYTKHHKKTYGEGSYSKKRVWADHLHIPVLELELELIQIHMAQKPVLRVEMPVFQCHTATAGLKLR